MVNIHEHTAAAAAATVERERLVEIVYQINVLRVLPDEAIFVHG